MKTASRPNTFIALIPILFLIGLLYLNVKIFNDTLEGANQIILLLSAFVAVCIALFYNIKWETLSKAMVDGISRAMPAMLILLMIGSLAGTWLLSGIVPSMIYYGLKIINPKIFLLTAVIISAIVSFATGSSWSTIATLGVALVGIGKTIGFNDGLVAGAIISGAYFGDKMSPLSDTTNLAPAVAGSDLFTHIRYMTITTTPSLIIACIIFTFIGFNYSNSTVVNIEDVSAVINEKFNITPLLLLIPVILIVIIIKKMPALPALLIGALLGAAAALIFQYPLVSSLNTKSALTGFNVYQTILSSMYGEIHIETSNPIISELFNTSGMAGMLPTVWLIICAMIFGGCMEAAGFLQAIMHSIVKFARSTGSLILTTIVSSVVLNVTASDQYISIIIPGRMYADSYKQKGLKPEVLSRTLEDGGTLTSVLVPWNTCGATQSKVLGVSTWEYLPYCFFNIINPVIAVIIGYLGYKIRKEEK